MDYRMCLQKSKKRRGKSQNHEIFREIDFTKIKITNRSPSRPDYVVRHLDDVGHYAYSLHYVDDEISRFRWLKIFDFRFRPIFPILRILKTPCVTVAIRVFRLEWPNFGLRRPRPQHLRPSWGRDHSDVLVLPIGMRNHLPMSVSK